MTSFYENRKELAIAGQDNGLKPFSSRAYYATVSAVNSSLDAAEQRIDIRYSTRLLHIMAEFPVYMYHRPSSVCVVDGMIDASR